MVKVYLMKYDPRGLDDETFMYVHANDFSEAVSIGNEMCEARGFKMKSVQYFDEWTNMNNMTYIPVRG